MLSVSVMVGKVGTAEHHLQDQITHERSQKSLDDRPDDKNKNKRESEWVNMQNRSAIMESVLFMWAFERHHTLKTSNCPSHSSPSILTALLA